MGVNTRSYTDEDRKKGREGGSGGGGAFPAEGEWPATVGDAYETDVGKDKHRVWKIDFKVEAKDRTVVRKATIFLDNSAQVANMIEALGKRDDPDELLADDIVARRCRVVIKHKKSWKEGDDRLFAEIDYLLPPQGGGAGSARSDSRRESRDRDRSRGDGGGHRDDRSDRERGREREDRGRSERNQNPRDNPF